MAQWIRHRPPKPGIAGSSPAGGSRFSVKYLCKHDVFPSVFDYQVVFLLLISFSLSFSNVNVHIRYWDETLKFELSYLIDMFRN